MLVISTSDEPRTYVKWFPTDGDNQMQGYDILMLGVMAIAVLRGYTRGLAWQISSIASIVASYIVAYRFKDRVTPHIEMADPWRGLVAMMILFVGTSLVIWIVFQNIRGAIEKAKLKDFDKQLGAIFGGIKGAAWCTAITIVALSFLAPGMSRQIVDSRSGGYIARIIASSKRLIPDEVQQVVQPYIKRAEEQLQDRTPPSPPESGMAQDGLPWSTSPTEPSWPQYGTSESSRPSPQAPQVDDSWFHQGSDAGTYQGHNQASDQSGVGFR